MKRLLIALLLSLLSTTAYAQQWDQVNGSMQVRSGPSAPLVIIDQTASGQKIISLRAAGTEVCYATSTAFTCTGGFSFGGQMLAADGSASAPSYSFTNFSTTGWFAASGPTINGSIGGTHRHQFGADFYAILNDTATFYLGASSSLVATREANDHWFQRRSTNAQRASWANTYTSSTNYTSFSIDWQTTANTAIVGTRTAATGTGRTLRLYAQATNAGAGGGVLELSPSGGVMVSATAPTIASGGCTSPAVTWNNGTAAFLITIGTSCTGVKTVTLTLPAATNLWACDGHNNTSDAQQQTNYPTFRATSTTAVVLTSYDRVTGLQEDFTASDTYLVKCLGG